METIIVHDHIAGNSLVAGLSLLERCVVAAHRSGSDSIVIVARVPLPRFRRLSGLGIQPQIVPAVPSNQEPRLLLFSHVLVQAPDLKAVIERGGILTSPDSEILPVAMLEPGSEFSLKTMNLLPRVKAEGVAGEVHDEETRRGMERSLWLSLQSTTDGLVDRRLNRPLGRNLTKCLLATPVSPNMVSIVSILLGIAGGFCFASTLPMGGVAGAVLLQLSAVIDCVDGDLARVLFKESVFGKWLDLVGDQVVHLFVLAGIPVGLARAGWEAPWFLLAGSAVAGAAVSFLVVLRGQRNPVLRQDPKLQHTTDSMANRDFSILVLFLAIAGKLEWFVWMAAIGVHLFWAFLLFLQWKSLKLRVGQGATE